MLLCLAAAHPALAAWHAEGDTIAFNNDSFFACPRQDGGWFGTWAVEGLTGAVQMTGAGELDPGWTRARLIPAIGFPAYVHYTTLPLGVVSDGGDGEFLLQFQGWSCSAHCAGEPGNVYLQHVLGDGSVDPQWPSEGRIAVDSFIGPYLAYGAGIDLQQDGRGGVVMGWTGGGFVVVQAMDGEGRRRWGPDGITIAHLDPGAPNPGFLADGRGGAFVFWTASSGSGSAVMGQHIDASGTLSWGDPVRVSRSSRALTQPEAVTDGSGGAIVIWNATSNGTDVFAARVTAGGGLPWRSDVAICSADGNQVQPHLVASDGGAIVTWLDPRATGIAIVSQSVSHDGRLAWAAGGVPLCQAPGFRQRVVLAGDGRGGAYVAWVDRRPGFELVATHVAADGRVASGWQADGTPVPAAPPPDGRPDQLVMIPSAPGSAIVAWGTLRTYQGGVAEFELAMRLDPGGPAIEKVAASKPASATAASLRGAAGPLAIVGITPVPATPSASIRMMVPEATPLELQLLDIAGRTTFARELRFPPGERVAPLFEDGARPAAGVYFLRLTQGSASVTRRVVIVR